MRYFFGLVLTILSTIAAAQFQLKGRVIAADSKTALPNASVFLSNTSVGTVTNNAGEFTLFIPAGKYDLISSFVGYETNAQTISGNADSTLLIKLQPKAKVLDEVVVGSFEKDGWKKWGRFFLDNFIGTSEWAADCAIKNYKVIRFRNNKRENKLVAVAGDQLIIENKALGYTIKYQLEDFEYNFKTRYFLYLGYPLFEEMEGGEAKQNKWNKRRQETYYGSLTDFMRALYRNRIVEAGFEVRRLVKRPNEEKIRVKELYRKRALATRAGANVSASAFSDSSDYYNKVLGQPDELSSFSPYTITGDSIAYKVDSITAGLEFDNYLHIIYTKSSPPKSYIQLSPHNGRIMSELKLMNAKPVQIQHSGNYYPPLNLVTLGYWAWSEKIGNMLPLDYKPLAQKK